MQSSLVARTYALIRPYGLKKLWTVLGLSLLQALFQVIGVTSVFPFFSLAADPEKFRHSLIGRQLLDHLPSLETSQLLLVTGCASLALLLISSALSVTAQYARAEYAQGFAHWLRMRLLSRLASRPYPYFLENNPALLNKKLNHDVQQFTNNVLIPLLDVATGLVVMSFLTITILTIDFRVSLGAILVIGSFYALAFGLLSGRRKSIDGAKKHAMRESNDQGLGFISGIKTIRIFGAQQHYIESFREHSRTLARTSARLPVYISAPKHMVEPIVFGSLIVFLILIVGRGENLTTVLPVLSVIALAGYRMIPAVQLLYARLTQISSMRHVLDEVADEFAAAESWVPKTKGKQADFHIEKIALAKAGFSYPGSEHPVLEEIDLEITHGDAVAIGGESGAGKSTLVDILLGLQKPTRGDFLVNGAHLTEESLSRFHARIGYVQQDCFLTNESIRCNIALGEPEAAIDEARLREACRRAQILDTIERDFDEGFDTVAGDRGARLSGGQRQRIALARALYREPEVLILDEATSALDHSTESAVAAAVNELKGEITLIVITHREQTVRNFPRKFHLQGGRISAL